MFMLFSSIRTFFTQKTKEMNFSLKCCIFLVTVTQISGQTTYYRRIHFDVKDQSCTLLEQEVIPRSFKGFNTNKDDNEFKIKLRPAITSAAESMLTVTDQSQIVEIWAKKNSIVENHIAKLCKSFKEISPLSEIQQDEIEVVKIIDGGNQSNRIDVVFMGDGYLLEERDQFFQDMQRLTDEMFQGVTFRSYLPVFNIWAIFVPSVESGIGYNGPKNTPFKLQRAAGQLRGISTGNASYARQVCQLTGTGGCDYPSLIGNDDFYGGLGGEFVISTKSNRTGTVVLRHEMTHNFVDVGEEYDNGGVYRGVNSARSLNAVGWGHWLTNNVTVREERAIYRILEYPWSDLWADGIQVINFTSDGTYNRWLLSLSVSAAGEEDSLEFTLDGIILPWNTSGFDDREFYDWTGDEGFSAGQHTFTVRTKTPPTHPDIPRMICSVRLHEFGDESEFSMDNSVVSAYPTWDSSHRVTYRPTNQGCLMRNMTYPKLCPVCREGMWHQFLTRINIIDGVQVASNTNPDGTRTVTLNTLKLAQLRDEGNKVEGEWLEVRWYHNDREMPQFQDLFEIDAQSGNWSVRVHFSTPEVRSDPTGLLDDTEVFTVL